MQSNNSNYILEVQNLVKRYAALSAVDDVSFSIKKGTCFGLLGPNGAGKTTVLETIENIIQPSSGKIFYKGKERNSHFQQEVGIQFQETALLSFLTIKETLEVFQGLYVNTLALDEIIEVCLLKEILHKFNDKISGGQKQRLLLGLAMINDPDLLFLDEPSTGMDPQNRRNLWQIIKSIKEQGKTIILTTHYMEEASYLCDEVAIMEHGKIIAQGSPDALIRDYTRHVTIVLPRDKFISLPDKLCMSVYDLEDSVEIQTNDINQCIQELIKLNIDLAELTVRSPNLEDVFIHLTGRSLRE